MNSTATASRLSGSVAAIGKFADAIVDILSVPGPILGWNLLRAMSVVSACLAKLRPAIESEMARAPDKPLDPDDEVADLLTGVLFEFERLEKTITAILSGVRATNFIGWLMLRLVRRNVRVAYRHVEELRQFIRERDADVSPESGTFSDAQSLRQHLRGS